MRPGSIVRYERLYLASFVPGLAGAALEWREDTASAHISRVLVGPGSFQPFVLALVIVAAVTLWYFTARRPSLAAKWVVMLIAVFSLWRLADRTLTVMRDGASAALVLGIAASLLYVAATLFLFRPDARAWFGEANDGDDDA